MKIKYQIYAIILVLGLAPIAFAGAPQAQKPSAGQARPAAKATRAMAGTGRTGSAPAAPQIIVRDVQFHSESLARDMKYRIILPADYETTVRRYPVLYLLHGLMGSYVDWEGRTNLAQYVRGLGLIVVMPDGNDAWYTNSAGDPQDRFEDYIAKDMIAEIDGKYRTIATRHERAIAGLSMGGYGAMKFALKYPQLFVFAGSFSGAMNATTNINLTALANKYTEGKLRIFGPEGSQTRQENDLLLLLGKANPAALPYLYIDCGTADTLLKANREFVAGLTAQKVAYEYHEVPGAHSWQYWDRQVQEMLRVLEKKMDLQGKSTN
jgi:S-formylglutathione hydrolase FrmB